MKPGLAIEGITPALVKKVTDDNLVDCTVDDLEVHNVRLKAIETGANQGLIVVPKKDSWVLIGSIEGTEEFVVLQVEEAEKVLGNIGGIKLEIDKNSLRLNGDGHGNLIIESELKAELDKVTKFLNEIKRICAFTVYEPGNGAPSVFQQFLNGALSSLQTPTYQNISNPKVKHG